MITSAVSLGLSFVGGLAARAAIRFGWGAVCAAAMAVAVALWLALSSIFGGPSALEVAQQNHIANVEASNAIALANAEELKKANTRASDAEAAAGEERAKGAAKAALARVARKQVAVALAPTAAVVCFPPSVVELLRK